LEYSYAGKTWIDFGEKKQPNKWVTLRAFHILSKLNSLDHRFPIMDVIADGVKQSPPLEGDCFGTKRLAMTQNRDLLKLIEKKKLGFASMDNPSFF